MEPFERIRRFLGAVRRRKNMTSRLEALCAVIAIAGIAVLLGLGLALIVDEGSGRAGWVIIAAGGVLAGWCVWGAWLGPARRRASDEPLALWVEDRLGGLDSGLITSVQTAPLVADTSTAPDGFSSALAIETATRTSRRLSRLSPISLDSRMRLKKLALGASLVVFAIGTLAMVNPGFYTEGARRITTGPPALVAAGERLVDVAVGQLAIEIRAPGYVGAKPRILPKTAGSIEAIEGSEVRFATSALFPAQSAVLLLESEPDARWPLELGADGGIRGAMRVGVSDRYQFMLGMADGTVIKERMWRTVDSRPDGPPEVELLLPESDLEVKPTDEVSFFFEAVDDFGLHKVELVITDDTGDELQRRVVRSPHGERLSRGDEAVLIQKLGLEPGDSVEVHFEAFDLNDLSGPGVGQSGSRRLSLYSPEAEHQRLLTRLDKLVDTLIEILADRLESPIDAKDPLHLGRYVEVAQHISASTRLALEEMGQLLGALATDTLAGDALRAGLQEVLGRLQDVHEQEEAHLKRAVLNRSRARAGVMVMLLHGGNEEAIGELEYGILKLKGDLDQARKDSILDAGRELLETQEEIMELLKKLKETKDPEALAEALKKLAKLQKKLNKLQRELAKLGERVPYENQNAAQRPGVRQQEIKDISSQMDQIQKLLAEGKVDEAMKLLEELTRSTQAMMAALQDDLDSGAQMSASARQKADEFSTKLDELADTQRGLKQETDRVGDQSEQRQAEQMREEAAERLAELSGKAREVREALDGADNDALPPSDREALEQLRRDATGLEQDVKQGRLSEAAEAAGKLSEAAEALKQEIGESEKRELDEQRLDGLQQGMDKLGEGQQKAQELASELQSLRPEPGQGVSEAEGAEMERLGKRQGQLRKGLDELSEKLDELDGEMPGIKSELGEPLENAGKKMGEAQSELGERRSRSAEQRQQEALEQLEQAQQQMQEKMSQQGKGQGGPEQPGVSPNQDKVPIPEEDSYKRPQNFREEVLKAMKERAPERYKDEIQRFYEELIKK